MSAKKDFVISRVFDAPLELMWKVWTDCNHLKHWWGPKGFTVRVCKLDLRPGGLLHYCLNGPDGKDMWGKFVFREIEKQAKLVFVNSFSDENAATARHFAHECWPLEMLSTILFTKEGNKTRVTVSWIPLNATEAESKTFYDNFESMNQGWGGTFDQLAEYLKKA